eukprot:TRINITY_DN4581_c0_g1_i6.p1 TRINITY_DN4581_c0_g1~~TRINITY_DN4581_c0_g1_i6.p1  ORF type:complete len:232 (-),score=81.21 TRINITY_DN4581_c0_g1_i6:103-798(-)
MYYLLRMKLADEAVNKAKNCIVKNASTFLRRSQEIYNRSLKAKELEPEKIEKLSKKYQQMETAARLKVDNQRKQWRQKREDYLQQLSKLEAAREAAELAEKEKTDGIMNFIALREEHASKSRMEIMEENAKRRLQQRRTNNRMTDLPKVEIMRKKQEEKRLRAAAMKSYNESVRAIKEEVAAKFRSDADEENYSNPYIVAEMRVKKKFMEIQKKGSLLEKEANKTSGMMFV